MTKQQLKDKYKEWNKRNASQAYDEENRFFKALQDLNKTNGDGRRWCCAETNLGQIIQYGSDCNKRKAFELYAEYNQEKGRQESFKELALLTDNFKI